MVFFWHRQNVRSTVSVDWRSISPTVNGSDGVTESVYNPINHLRRTRLGRLFPGRTQSVKNQKGAGAPIAPAEGERPPVYCSRREVGTLASKPRKPIKRYASGKFLRLGFETVLAAGSRHGKQCRV